MAIFELFFGVAAVVTLDFTDIFAMIGITTYHQKIYMQCIFSMAYEFAMFELKMRHNDYNFGRL